MDPQERLFLQCVYETLEDAGYTREALGKYQGLGLEGNIGVYVGVMYEEYQLYGAQEQAEGKMVALSGNPASIANRVSYFCNFHGPSIAMEYHVFIVIDSDPFSLSEYSTGRLRAGYSRRSERLDPS